ncbi:MAG: hypothetical protein AB7V36_09495 [Bacteroidales bacterium]
MEPTTKTALQALKNLHLADNRLRYPNLPEYARSTPKYSDTTANGLTKCIIDFIRYSGGQAERINCTGRIIKKGYSQMYIPTSGQRGTADISATIQGRSVKIEVKIGRDRQSEYQKQYQSDIEASGGIYYIAKDFVSFYAWYLQNFERVGK